MIGIDGMIEVVKRGFAPDATPEAKAEAAKVLRAGLVLLDAPAPAPASSSTPRAPRPAPPPQPDVLGALVQAMMGMLPEWKQRQVQAQVAADVPFVGPFVGPFGPKA